MLKLEGAPWKPDLALVVVLVRVLVLNILKVHGQMALELCFSERALLGTRTLARELCFSSKRALSAPWKPDCQTEVEA